MKSQKYPRQGEIAPDGGNLWVVFDFIPFFPRYAPPP